MCINYGNLFPVVTVTKKEVEKAGWTKICGFQRWENLRHLKKKKERKAMYRIWKMRRDGVKEFVVWRRSTRASFSLIKLKGIVKWIILIKFSYNYHNVAIQILHILSVSALAQTSSLGLELSVQSMGIFFETTALVYATCLTSDYIFAFLTYSVIKIYYKLPIKL
jgi:hypothetical protein